ncbi:P-loop containing nucleoside triphosphate hydrolase protein [Rickenella mellea]|uniref:P-loop containing nucleoside triphosphate hydrolase protein n=1 Tax=Rickenella mellea TaxID=50990 RepID=A0A4Y7PYQ2_9AGAM|nr:P-loop containing nucleoside triphosphate hydrolase protein [Rickenella mellea]
MQLTLVEIAIMKLVNSWSREHFLLIPPGLAVLSFSYLLIKGMVNQRHGSSETADATDNGDSTVGASRCGEKSHTFDGPVIVCFRLLYLLAVLALLSLVIYQISADHASTVRIILAMFYIYTSMLAGCAIFLSPRQRDASHVHASLLLLTALAVYGYLDVWPLATMDPSEPGISRNWLIWVRIGLLSVSGAFVPLISPRPFRPQYPDEVPNPEYTCSLFSSLTYSFLDPIIFYAYRVPDITMKDLPPLPREESAGYIADKNFPKLDPVQVGTKRHIFWGISRVFATRYARVILCVISYASAQFVGPLGLKNLLSYLEDGRPQIGLRPWVWVVLVAIGPMIAALIFNQYLYESTMITVECDSLLTQLVFEHSLRIRMKSDLFDDKKGKIDDDKTANASEATSSATTPTVVEDDTPAEDATSGAQTPADRSQTPAQLSDPRKGESDDAAKEKEPTKQKEKSAHLIGKINNLLTTDLNQVKYTQDALMILSAIIQVTISIIFLYYIMGWSAFVGMGCIVLCLPLPAYVGSIVMKVQKAKMERTDARVQAVTETMNILRMVKLFAWEMKLLDQITAKRETELRWVRYGKFLEYLALSNSNAIIPMISMLASFGTYTLVMRRPLTASVAFTAISIFASLTQQMFMVVRQLPQALRIKVSLDRFNEFFNEAELLDNSLANNRVSAFAASAPSPDVIGFNAATFSWTNINQSQRVKPATRVFRLHFDGEIRFRRGGINLIIGPTASGKTSLLMALLGEMYYKPHGPGSWFNLPRDGGIAYAAQESWVLNETVKENILFGEPYEEQRYQTVLMQCALERDLSMWEAGDQTEVGEKGLTLSGGQKARVTLARALYSRAEILLLDDVLAALDVHTAKWVVDKALKGDIVAGRTVLLVTHNVALTSSMADFVITLGKNGRVTDHGSISDILKKDAKLRAAFEKEKALAEKVESDKEGGDDDERKVAGKLVVLEEKAMGRVERAAMMLFFHGFGNALFWVITLFSKVSTRLLQIAGPVWISYWSSQYALTEHVPALRYLGVYALIQLVQLSFDSLSSVFWVLGTMNSSRIIHYKLIQSIFSAPLRWLDTVPIGRVITRCTQDIDAVDNSFARMASMFLEISISLIGNFFVSIYMAGWPALLSGGIMAILGGWLGMVYLKAQLSVRRELSNAKSPVMSQVGQTLAGLPSIRAYGAEGRFRVVLRNRIDPYIRASLTFYNINRWIGIRANSLGAMFSTVVTTYLVYGTNIRAGSVGLTLTVVRAFAGEILWWVRIYNFMEIEANSLERVLDFLRIDQEPTPVESGKPPASWPCSGSLVVDGLSARYSDEGPEVLQDLHFEIASGERVGVVGRTGAGKSSLALALLRTIPTTGTVHFDGLPTHSINLDALRSSVTLIPQQPELLRGTLRENLDPFGQHDDATLNDALRSSGLFQLQDERKPPVVGSSETAPDTEEGSAAIGLDTQIDAGGSNFSLGQRQIIALARAIVRQSRLLILDEATAAIDYETDTAIQTSLRTELSKDTTVITIAHRLQTIMDSDKIMVLEGGRLMEFDSPKNLLQNDSSLLRALVDESGDSAHLKDLAGIRREPTTNL